MTYVDRLQEHGTKVHCHLTADTDKELWRMAERLREPVKDAQIGKCPHLDLTPRKRVLALRYGAQELDNK